MTRPAGVDVSRWQGEVDWQALKASGISFAAIRATIGDFFTDDRFAENWQGAKDAGIFRCAYHVLRPDIDATAQIAHFDSVVGEAGDLPHVLDVELTGGQPNSVIQDRTFESLQELEARFGRTPLVYTADWFWTPRIGDQPWVENYDLWVAHYYWPQVQTPKVPAGWMVWRSVDGSSAFGETLNDEPSTSEGEAIIHEAPEVAMPDGGQHTDIPSDLIEMLPGFSFTPHSTRSATWASHCC